MPKAVHPFLKHVETYLGPIQNAAQLREGVQGAFFQDRPRNGTSSFLTLGLSHHIFSQENGPGLRVELLLACKNEFVDLLNPMSILADICDRVVPAHCAPTHGTVFGPGGRFFRDSEMEALYCSPASSFDNALSDFTGFPEPFVLIWLVPITASEATYVHTQGWEKFEETLEAADPDLLDLQRQSVVSGI